MDDENAFLLLYCDHLNLSKYKPQIFNTKEMDYSVYLYKGGEWVMDYGDGADIAIRSDANQNNTS